MAPASRRRSSCMLPLLLLAAASPGRGCDASPHPRKTTAYCGFIPSSLGSGRCRCSPTPNCHKIPMRNRKNTTVSHSTIACIWSCRMMSKSESGLERKIKIKKNEKSSPEAHLGRRARKLRLQKLEYQRRRNRWTKRYGSLEALQSTFGKGPPWGDLSPTQTRALYHTLLPRSLLALNEMGLMKPDELAPLAYEARIAAKEYARSRCVITGRIGTALFDQYRSLRDKGRLLTPGTSGSMTWEEIWSKYEGQIVREVCEGALKDEGEVQDEGNNEQSDKEKKKKKKRDDKSKKKAKTKLPVDEEDLTMRIYLRILEKSCATNQAFDSLFLDRDGSDDGNLAAIASQLDNDVRSILLSPEDISKATKEENKKKKKEQKAMQKEEKRKRKQLRKDNEYGKEDYSYSAVDVGVSGDGDVDVDGKDDVLEGDKSQKYSALRILAGTRRQFKLLLNKRK